MGRVTQHGLLGIGRWPWCSHHYRARYTSVRQSVVQLFSFAVAECALTYGVGSRLARSLGRASVVVGWSPACGDARGRLGLLEDELVLLTGFGSRRSLVMLIGFSSADWLWCDVRLDRHHAVFVGCLEWLL